MTDAVRPALTAVLGVLAVAITGCGGGSGVGGSASPDVASVLKGKIAFTLTRQNASSNVAVLTLPDRTIQELTTDGNSGEPVWSPDGRKIAYSYLTGDYDIRVMRADGTRQRSLTSDGSSQSPTWSPDGTRIAFAGYRGTDFRDLAIYVMNADGSDVKRLTRGTRAYYMQPAWSPDGGEIAFACCRTGDAEIYVMNSDGTNVRRLTREPRDDDQPAWSPDGSRIAFHSLRSDWHGVYVMNRDGGGVRLVYGGAAATQALRPAWAPNGRQIALSGGGIVAVSADGDPHPRQLTEPGWMEVHAAPDWWGRRPATASRDDAGQNTPSLVMGTVARQPWLPLG